MAANPNDNDCPDPVEVCLTYHEESDTYTLLTNFGNEKPGIPAGKPAKVTGQFVVIDGKCFLQIFVNKVLCDTVDAEALFGKLDFEPSADLNSNTCNLVIKVGELESSPINMRPLLEQYKVTYNPQTHGIQCTIKGQPFGEENLLNCGTFDIVLAADGRCYATYKNEKGQETQKILPQTIISHDATACTLTLNDPAKPGDPLVIGLGALEDQVGMSLDDNCDLVFCYKDKKVTVPLPNFVTAVSINPAECTLTTTYWKGDPVTVDYLQAVNLAKDETTGAVVLTIKGQTCVIAPPVEPDGYSELGLVAADGSDGQGNQIVDFQGNAIPAGISVINYYDKDGNYVNSKDCTIPQAFPPSFSVVSAAGEITTPSGQSVPAVDGQGNPIDPDSPVLNIWDADGNYVGSKLCDTPTVFNKVDAEGNVTTFNSASDCVPEFAYQSVTDEDGRSIIANDKATILGLDRSLHVSSPSHYAGSNKIGVSHSDSDQADTGVITNTHLAAVSTSEESSATSEKSHVISSLRVTASGDRSIVSASSDSQASGPLSGITASRNSTATAARTFIAGSLDSNATEDRSAVISSNRGNTSAIHSAIVGSTIVDFTDGQLKFSGGAVGVQSTDGFRHGFVACDTCSMDSGTNQFIGGTAMSQIDDSESSAIIGSATSSIVGSRRGAIVGSQGADIIGGAQNMIGASILGPNGNATIQGARSAVIATVAGVVNGFNQAAVIAGTDISAVQNNCLHTARLWIDPATMPTAPGIAGTLYCPGGPGTPVFWS